MTSISAMAKKAAVATSMTGLLLATVVSSTPASAVGGRQSPDESVTFIEANLHKAFGGDFTGPSITDMSSVKRFVSRALELSRFRPDVLLLSEVRYKAAKAAARSFTRKTGDRYVIAVAPPPNTSPTIDYKNKQIHRETAIVYNAATMKTLSSGGFIGTTYDKSQAAVGEKVSVNKQAYTLLEQRATGKTFPVAAIHFTAQRSFRTKDISNNVRLNFTQKVLGVLKTKYPNASVYNMGGDFNADRCFEGAFASCKQAKFWEFLASKGLADSLWFLPNSSKHSGCNKEAGVDYVFTTGALTENWGGVDGKEPDYSDHKMTWVTVTAGRRAFPTCLD